MIFLDNVTMFCYIDEGGDNMDQNLISKKELLDLTGISYGQLYRWKRKNLIPESWFIKKSSFTGQETFFPKEDILLRIEKIKNMKDDVQLDELAGYFSPSQSAVILSGEALLKHNIVSSQTLESLNLSADKEFSFQNILFVYIADNVLKDGIMNIDEVTTLFELLLSNNKEMAEGSLEIIFCRKRGISMMFLTESKSKLFVENDLKIIFRSDLQSYMEELKIKLNCLEKL